MGKERIPFNQTLLHLEDLVPLDKLYNSLIELYEHFSKLYSESDLYLNHDWHEHDRYVNKSEIFIGMILRISLKIHKVCLSQEMKILM